MRGLRGVTGYSAGVECGGIHVKASAGFQHVRGQQSDAKRECRYHFEIQQRFATHAADLAHVVHAGDASHDSAENHRADDHAHEFDEGIAKRFHRHGIRRQEMAHEHTDNNRHDHLNVQHLIEWFALHVSSIF